MALYRRKIVFGERRSSRHARLGCRNCNRTPIRSLRELRKRVGKSKEESIEWCKGHSLAYAPADKLQPSNKFLARTSSPPFPLLRPFPPKPPQPSSPLPPIPT